MSSEERAKRALQALAKGLSAAGSLRASFRELRDRAGLLGVRMMDEVVSALAQRPVQTRPELFKRKAQLSGPDEPAPPAPPSAPPREKFAAPQRDVPAAPKREAPAVASTEPSLARAPGPEPARKPRREREARPAPQGEVAPQVGAVSVTPPHPAAIVTASKVSPPVLTAEARLPAGVTSPEPPAPAPKLVPEPVAEEFVLLARDPERSFAFWKLDPVRVAAARRPRPGARAMLRMHDAETGIVCVEAEVDPVEGRYYLENPETDRRYFVTLALVSTAGVKELSRSGVILVPPRAPRMPEPPVFMSIEPQARVLEAREQLEPPPRLESSSLSAPVSPKSSEAFTATQAAVASLFSGRAKTSSVAAPPFEARESGEASTSSPAVLASGGWSGWQVRAAPTSASDSSSAPSGPASLADSAESSVAPSPVRWTGWYRSDEPSRDPTLDG